MSRLDLGQFHIGQLFSRLAVRIAEAVKTGPSPACYSYKGDEAATMDRVPAADSAAGPLAVLDAGQRRWPSRYY